MHIWYEDEELMVVEKPAGLPTTTEPGGIHPTVAELLLEYAPHLRGIGKAGEAGILHRLDNATSGCLLVAKTVMAYDALRAQFAARTVQKRYTALLLGAVPTPLCWTQPIAHHPKKSRRMMVCTTASENARYKAQVAHTLVDHSEYFPPGVGRPIPYSLCAISITTGVRHQIRAHCAAAGYPIAGDRLYQSPAARHLDRLPLHRHFLHATQLTFQHPTSGTVCTIESPLPQDLNRIVKLLRK